MAGELMKTEPKGTENRASFKNEEQTFKDLLIDLIKDGFNTIRLLRLKTGKDERIILRELEILRDIYIVFYPPPPVVSFWIKGKAPKHGIFIKDGRAYAKPAPEQPRASPQQSFKKTDTPSQIQAEKQITHTVTSNSVSLPQITGNSSGDEFCSDMPLELLLDHVENPRGVVNENEEDFIDLVNSISEHGIQQPAIVTPIKGTKTFRIVIGHRRCKAARRAGKTHVPAIIRRFKSSIEEFSVMLIENIQRKDLNPIQEARGIYKQYLDLDKDIHATARTLGLNQSFIKSRIKLLKLHYNIQMLIERGEIPTGIGELLSGLTEDQQIKLLPRAQRLTKSELSEVILRLNNKSKILASTGKKIKTESTPEEQPVIFAQEKFSRISALKSLDDLGEETWFSIKHLKYAMLDACADTCGSSSDEDLCKGCPVPRLVFSMTRRKLKEDSK